MRRLIVNADDFGYTRGVNRAIVHGYRTGIVTSTSLMASGAAFEDAVEQARREPGLDVGCHVNFVEGKALSARGAVPHLVQSDGRFLGARRLAMRLVRGAVPMVELERECAAQVEALLAAGIRPSHLDTHQHTHLHPRVARAVAAAARRYSIPWMRRPFENCRPAAGREPFARKALRGAFSLLARSFERIASAESVAVPDFFTGFTLTGRWSEPALSATLAAIPEGTTELVCHPGYSDTELDAAPTKLKHQRQRELEIFADAKWRGRLQELGIALMSFRAAGPEGLRSLPNSAAAELGLGLAHGE